MNIQPQYYHVRFREVSVTATNPSWCIAHPLTGYLEMFLEKLNPHKRLHGGHTRQRNAHLECHVDLFKLHFAKEDSDLFGLNFGKKEELTFAYTQILGFIRTAL